MASGSLATVKAHGSSPGNCNGGDGEISGEQDYIKIQDRRDLTAYLNGLRFHSIDCVLRRLEQEMLLDGRRDTRYETDLKVFWTEIKS